MQFYLEILTGDPLNYTTDHSKFIASIQKENFISSFMSFDETPNLVNFMLLSLTEFY